MLVLFRKQGQGIEVTNTVNGESYNFDYLYNKNGMNHYVINGEEQVLHEKQPFYLDPNSEVVVIVIKIEKHLRVGIEASKQWNIVRKEIKKDGAN